MNSLRSRRDFFADVGRGTLVAAVGAEIALDMGFSKAWAEEKREALSFGEMEQLVCLMQETPVDRLLPKLVAELKSGTQLRQLVAAGALANARTFGGEDYVGYHTMMALSPAFYMASELPSEQQALPVFKVLYRNTNRLQERGGRKEEVLTPVKGASLGEGQRGNEVLREAVRAQNMNKAEAIFATLAAKSPEDAFNDLLYTVHDHTEVHRVVFPYRAWDLLGLIGKEHAHTLLRQSVRYCIKAEAWNRPESAHDPRRLVPRLFDEYKLAGKVPGSRRTEDKWVEELSEVIFKSNPTEAGAAAAAALAEGYETDAVGEAICLAANQLVLRDIGRTAREEIAGKPIGSVHGDSIGVHACDSANAWRNMARASNGRNCFASLILGASQVALDRTQRGGDFVNWQPLPLPRHVEQITATDPGKLLNDLNEAVRGNLQARACALVHRYGELGHPERPVLDLLLGYAVSEDGSLHAEKYYRTASEEFTHTRKPFRWRHLVALARVTASEYGRPAAGVAEARSLLRI